MPVIFEEELSEILETHEHFLGFLTISEPGPSNAILQETETNVLNELNSASIKYYLVWPESPAKEGKRNVNKMTFYSHVKSEKIFNQKMGWTKQS